MADIWHFKRDDLAQHILGNFETNMSSALTIFAPRRMGKTELLRKDITPLAEAHGWRVFYFSFFDARSRPMEEFTHALSSFSHGGGLIGDVRRVLARTTKKVDVGPQGVAQASIETEARPLRLSEVFDRIARGGKVLMLLDEIQVLSTIPDDGFVASLRTALDKYKDNIKTIFTGSSRDGLVRMFSQSHAPFFHFSTNVDLPQLSRPFVEHLAMGFNAATRRSLDVDALLKWFESMGRTPQHARTLVERMALNPSLSMDEVAAVLIQEISQGGGFNEKWVECNLLERILLVLIATGSGELYSVPTRATIAQQMGIESIEAQTIQNALKGLRKRVLLFKPPVHGSPFEIEDSMFKRWILESVA